ncbi:MAG: serine-rich protein [Anaerolineales bacterium]
MLDKTHSGMRGLYNAHVDALYMACGIFTPRRVGIAQFYGATAEGNDEREAAELAINRLAAVKATLANFPQTRTRPPELERMEWLFEFLSHAPHVLCVLGHPDPRKATKGMGKDGSLSEADDELSEQQNELLFRGLAKLKENFVFQIVTEAIPRRRLASGLQKVAQISSVVASRQRGSLSMGFSIGVPLMAALSSGHGSTESGATAHSSGVSDAASKGWGRSHTDSQAHTDSVANTVGGSESHTFMKSHTDSKGVADGQSWGQTFSEGSSIGSGTSQSMETGSSDSTGTGANSSNSSGNSGGLSATASVAPGGIGGSLTGNAGWDSSHSEGASNSTGHSDSSSSSSGSNTSESTQSGWAVSSGGSHVESSGSADTEGESVSVSKMWATTHGQADTVGSADGVSENYGQAHGTSESDSVARGVAGSSAVGSGFATGLVPSGQLGRAWQVEDDMAQQLTATLRMLVSQCNQASQEGGFWTDAYLILDTPRGESAAASLVAQAFHGPAVAQPVMTIACQGRDIEHVRKHAQTFTSCSDEGGADQFNGLLWRKYSTMLTPGQLAAYMAPGLFAEGTAVTVQEVVPPVAFYPDMKRQSPDGTPAIVIGHQYSPETGDLTDVPVYITRERMFHMLFAGDTGYGKSVLAERVVYESVVKWKLRTMVLDFGAGWRRLAAAPGLEGRVGIYQLWPGAVKPLHWNPLRVPRRLPPEMVWRGFADVFGAVSRAGVKRMIPEVRDALRTVYLNAGVLVDDPELREDPQWGTVRVDDAAGTPGVPLEQLSPQERQRIAVKRSERVGLADLYGVVERKFKDTNPRDQMLRGVLEGILFRLHPLVRGAAAVQYAASPDACSIDEVGQGKDLAILEGGSFLDESIKAFLLAWAGWVFCNDNMMKRVQAGKQGTPDLQIVLEECNKILGGVEAGSSGGDEEGGGKAYIGQLYSDFFRDSRKYGVWLHPICQSPSLLPPGIASSCDNMAFNQLKASKDRDLAVAAIARSEKGLTDENWRRYLGRLPVGEAVIRLGYSMDIAEQEPMRVRPLMLNVPEPSDEELKRYVA